MNGSPVISIEIIAGTAQNTLMRIKYLLGLLFCFAWTMPLFSQTISGTVNTYAGVNAIAGNAFTVTSSAGFAVGDLVLVIQMKGASITQTNSPAYGDITGYGNAGNYEFNTVGSIAGNVITLACNLTNAYDIPGRVQLVRVPQYTNVTVTGTLTAQDWNGTTGGVLAIDVSNTLTLNANIDVSNRGFRGGTVGAGGFNCAHSTYFSPTNQGGTKGEAIANAIAGQETARGKLANGGGGSNAGNCGAGGGSNFGTGGLGAPFTAAAEPAPFREWVEQPLPWSMDGFSWEVAEAEASATTARPAPPGAMAAES